MSGATENQYRQLRDSTGRLVTVGENDGTGGSGTAFFVAPNVLLTAAHVVASSLAEGKSLEFHWQDRVVAAVVKQVFPALGTGPSVGAAQVPPAGSSYPYPDLAVVEVRLEGVLVPLLGDEPTPGDELYAYGYTDEYPEGDSALFVYEGPTNQDELMYRLKDAQARPGLSGAPLLDVTRGGVVAMVKRSRDKQTDLGSRAIPMATALAHVPTLAAATSGRPVLSGEAVSVERLLDMHKRNLQAYEDELANVTGPPSDSSLGKQADRARETIGELQARLDRLARQAPAPTRRMSPAASATLPPRSEFIGRRQEVDQLKRALASRSPVVAIEGMGGVGKTALALEVAHDWSSSGFEGVVWASTVQRPVALAELVDNTARVLDYPAVTRLPAEQKGAELCRVLAGHRYLVVLDGFEAVNDASIEAFVRSFPESNKTLLTSRRAVSDVRAISLRGLTAEEALELLHLESERIGVEGIDDVTDDVQTLYELTGGSPLALKWALGLMRQGYDLADVIESLETAEGEVFDVIMGRTWDALSQPGRRLLLVMPCFAAPATKVRMQLAAELLEDECDAAVEELTRGWLLEQQGTLSRRTFTVPPLLRAFANNRLLKDSQLEHAARLRLATTYLGLINECKTAYAEGFDRIEAELVNVLDTIEWCYARQQWGRVVDLADGLAEFLWVRGYWSERIKRATQGLEAARALGDGIAAGRFAYYIGWVYSRWHQQDEARRWADDAEAAMREVYGSDNPYALELHGLAAFRASRGAAPVTPEEKAAFQQAEFLLQRARSLFAGDTGLPNGAYLVTTVNDNLGELYRDWGRDDDACARFESVLAAAEVNHWEERLATANGDLGDLAFKAGNLHRARQLYESGLAHAIRIKRANTIALCRLGLGRAMRHQGHGHAAYDHLREALEIYKRLNATTTIETIEVELRTLAAELTPDEESSDSAT